MKKIFCFLCVLFSWGSSQTLGPEHYQKQIEILRNLDIDPRFMSDVVFVEQRAALGLKHSGVLIRALSHFSQVIPMIRKILALEAVPEEILYLAMVESGLKVGSVSNAKAVGLWQFMKPTVHKLGLRVDAYVDERMDLVKSTHAAATYLKGLRAEFGKWYLALLAYNCGEGKLRAAIRQAKSDDLAVLLDADKKYLSLETRNFMRKILTLAFLAHDKNFLLQRGGAMMNYSLSNDFIKIDLPSAVSLKDVARGVGLDLATLKKYNPQFRHSFTPPGDGYYAYIPLNKLAFFERNFKGSQLAKVDTTIPMTKIYKVKAGDSLYKIAKAHHINIEDLRDFNAIKNNHLSINQKLIIPIKEKKNAKITTKDSYAQIHSY